MYILKPTRIIKFPVQFFISAKADLSNLTHFLWAVALSFLNPFIAISWTLAVEVSDGVGNYRCMGYRDGIFDPRLTCKQGADFLDWVPGVLYAVIHLLSGWYQWL